MAVDSPAKLRKDAEDAKKVTEADYDRLAERDATITKLEAELEKVKKTCKEKIQKAIDLSVELKELKTKATTAEAKVTTLEAEAKKAQKDYDIVKRSEVYEEKRRIELQGELESANNKLKRIEKTDSNKFQAQKAIASANRSTYIKTTECEHLTNQLKAAKETAEEETKRANEAAAQLSKTHRELRETFSEGDDLTLPELVSRARQSAQPTIITRPKNNRLISGASLNDELNDAGYESNTDEDAEDSANGDDTITSPAAIAPPSPAPLSFSTIVSVDTKPVAGTKSPTAVTTPSTAVTDSPTAAAVTKPPTTAAATTPPTVAVKPEIRIVKEYHTVSRVPAWFCPLFLFLLALYALLLTSMVGERRVWNAANDLTRQRVVSMSLGGTSSWNPVMSVFSGLDGMLGRNYGLLG